MSLDVYLLDENGQELYSANITHNLTGMAVAAGIYKVLWRPDEEGFGFAGQIAPTLEAGLIRLVLEPTRFKRHDAENGWGRWRSFVPWVAEYLEACKQHPDAKVRVSR